MRSFGICDELKCIHVISYSATCLPRFSILVDPGRYHLILGPPSVVFYIHVPLLFTPGKLSCQPRFSSRKHKQKCKLKHTGTIFQSVGISTRLSDSIPQKHSKTVKIARTRNKTGWLRFLSLTNLCSVHATGVPWSGSPHIGCKLQDSTMHVLCLTSTCSS
jgi:hypothetical protein